jgi:phosphoglycolate phosphatase
VSAGDARRVVYVDLDGTLLGPGGSLFAAGDGSFTLDGARALRLLREAGVACVLVSGRTRARLAETARLFGLDGFIAELGALDAGYPTAPGQSVHEAIAAGGVPDALLERERGRLEPHLPWSLDREGSHVMRGRAGPAAAAFVREASGGALRLADNGIVRPDGTHVYHVLPAAAGKGAAVARDVASRGADPAACLAIGNSREDLEIAGAVGRLALVANAAADPALVADAEWITAGSFGAGVLEAVHEWLADGVRAARDAQQARARAT